MVLKQFRRWPLIIILSASGIAYAVVTGSPAGPFRAVLAFWFLLTCPGMAFIPLLRIREPMAQVPVAIALSIALDTAVAETQVLTGHWSTEGGLLLLIGICAAGLALQCIPMQTGAKLWGAR